jgi:hypothetical protein
MTTFTTTHSRWGNLYRRRHYINGARVTDDEFERRWYDVPRHQRTDSANLTTTDTPYGFRVDWKF